MSERQTAAEAVAAENDARRLAVQYAVAARDAEWRAAVERVRPEAVDHEDWCASNTNHAKTWAPPRPCDCPAHNINHALDSLLRAMEAPRG